MLVILYENNEKFNLDFANPYVLTEEIGRECISGGYNIFGEKLPDYYRPINCSRIRYSLGESIKTFKTLEEAHRFILEQNYIQVLHIH